MNKTVKIILLILWVIGFGLLGGLWGTKKVKPQERTFTIEARQYAYNPPVIRVNRGDKITLKLTSKDVTHGFYLEGYNFDAKVRPEMPTFWVRHPSKEKEYNKEPVENYTFIANRTGKFRYRCSIGCGPMHPFMQGEMIVEPNYLFPTAIGLVIGIAFVCITCFRRREEG